jgi:quercetin dioxygenase-like cupin family protein
MRVAIPVTLDHVKRLTHDDAARNAQPGDLTHFTGPVSQVAVHTSTEPETARVLLVGFNDGARTHWHTHSGGQVLHVVEGRGRTQVRGQAPVDLAPGDLVSVPPGEEHWHGAAEGEAMTHLAISMGTTDWGDPPD